MAIAIGIYTGQTISCCTGNDLDIPAIEDFNGAAAHAARDDHIDTPVSKKVWQKTRFVAGVWDSVLRNDDVVDYVADPEIFAVAKVFRDPVSHAGYSDFHDSFPFNSNNPSSRPSSQLPSNNSITPVSQAWDSRGSMGSLTTVSI